MKAGHPAIRAVVTGVGAVSAWGWGAESLRSALALGETAIGPFSRFDTSDYFTHVAAEAPAPPADLPRRVAGWSRLSHADRFAVASACEAVTAAGLPGDLSDLDAGVFFGSTTGGMFETETFYARWRGHSFARAPRHGLATQPVNRPGEAVARALRATGPVQTISSACASGTLAIGLALEALRAGDVSIALAGGADSLCRTTFGGFNALRSVAAGPCRPFLRDRSGLSLGEGGAVLVLERLDQALERGVRPLAELRGAGASADAHHMTAPEAEGRGAVLAMRRALDDAGCAPEMVDLINAHGTGTPLNDIAEFRAFERLFGRRATEIPLLATKASVGHLLGCAGAIEAVATVFALEEQRLQPTPGAGEVDPAAPVHLARGRTEARIDVALSLNLGFGGCNGALVLGRWSET